MGTDSIVWSKISVEKLRRVDQILYHNFSYRYFISCYHASVLSLLCTSLNKFSTGLMSGDLAGIGTTLEYILLNALCSSLQFCTGSPSCKNNLPSLLLALTRVAGKYLQTNLYFVYTNCCHCISQETVHISQQLCTKQ